MIPAFSQEVSVPIYRCALDHHFHYFLEIAGSARHWHFISNMNTHMKDGRDSNTLSVLFGHGEFEGEESYTNILMKSGVLKGIDITYMSNRNCNWLYRNSWVTTNRFGWNLQKSQNIAGKNPAPCDTEYRLPGIVEEVGDHGSSYCGNEI